MTLLPRGVMRVALRHPVEDTHHPPTASALREAGQKRTSATN